MATAKLWWNGSSWQTSNVNVIDESKTGNHQIGVRHVIKVAAWDDNTVRVSQWFEAYAPSGMYNYPSMDSTAVTIYSGGSSIGSGSISEKAVSSLSLTYSGSASAAATAGYTAYSSGTIYFSGSISPSNPRRTITFDANGGTGAPSTQTVLSGITATLTSSTPTRANHTFLGWNTDKNAHTATYSAGSSISITSNITLYAIWRPTVFISADEGVTITFNGTDYTNTTATIKNLTWGNSYTLTIKANAGWIIKTRSHADGSVTLNADEITISATGQRVGCHIDDGNEYEQAVMYMDTGNDWQMIQAYVDNGNSWELVY